MLSPILGTLADTRNFKKPIFTFCVAVGVIGCCAMGMASTWLPFLLIFIFAKVGFSGSLVFYDSMLSDVTVPDRMDEVSSKGYAWGYIGSCVPFVVCLALVLGAGSIGISQMTALNLALFITAAWWLVTTLPLLRQYKQVHFVEVQEHAIRQSFARIGHTLRHLKEDRQVFWFLLAFFLLHRWRIHHHRYGHGLRHGPGAWTPPACCWRCWSPRSWPSPRHWCSGG